MQSIQGMSDQQLLNVFTEAQKERASINLRIGALTVEINSRKLRTPSLNQTVSHQNNQEPTVTMMVFDSAVRRREDNNSKLCNHDLVVSYLSAFFRTDGNNQVAMELSWEIDRRAKQPDSGILTTLRMKLNSILAVKEPSETEKMLINILEEKLREIKSGT